MAESRLTSNASPRGTTGADLGGALGCVLAMAVGGGAFWAARDYSMLGAVFPRTVGALMVALGALYLVFVLLGRTRAAAALQGSHLRRALAAAVMLAWGFALGPLGFLTSSAVAMALLVLVAQHEPWRARSAVVCVLSCSAVLLGLYALFQHALLVPLP